MHALGPARHRLREGRRWRRWFCRSSNWEIEEARPPYTSTYTPHPIPSGGGGSRSRGPPRDYEKDPLTRLEIAGYVAIPTLYIGVPAVFNKIDKPKRLAERELLAEERKQRVKTGPPISSVPENLSRPMGSWTVDKLHQRT